MLEPRVLNKSEMPVLKLDGEELVGARQMNEMIQTVMNVFSQKELDEYPREALVFALEHEEEITPYLIHILEDLLADPEGHAHDRWSYAPAFAFHLLGHFKNNDAHILVVKVMSLPDKILDPIFGDMITEDFPRILYQTCGGRYDAIKGLVLNRNADEYVRGAAMRALVMGVLLKDLPRADAVDFFSGLLSGSEADDSSNFWSQAASCVWDLHPEELMGVIKDAYERDLIYPGYIDIDAFTDALAQDKEAYLQERKRYCEMDLHEDFHSRMSWWAVFRKESHGIPSREPGFGGGESKAKRKKKEKIARRKQAKASRKRNRR